MAKKEYMDKPKAIPLYLDLLEQIELLTDDERGRLFTAMLEYANRRAVDIELSGNERFLWLPIRGSIERGLQKWEAIAERNRTNGSEHKPKEVEPSGTQSNPVEPSGSQSNPVEPSGSQTNPDCNSNTKTNDQEPKNLDLRPTTTTNDTVGHAARTMLAASSATVEVLEGYAGKFREGEAIVLHAMNEAAANGDAVADPQAYTIGILKRYEREGVQTLVEAAASDHKGRSSAGGQGGSIPRAQDYQQRPYTGDVVNPFEDPFRPRVGPNGVKLAPKTPSILDEIIPG